MSFRLASMRLPISSTSASLMGVTSGRPMKRRASSGLHSTLTVNFIGQIPVARLRAGGSITRPTAAGQQGNVLWETAMGEWVQVQGPDGAFRAYVARPPGTPRGAVVAIQEIFGVNAVMRGKADWLAREGFLAIAPDLFWRIKPGIDITDQTDAEWKEALGYMNQLDKNASVKDVAATLTHARAMGASKAGCLGYCMGGYIAFLAACRTDTDAT